MSLEARKRFGLKKRALPKARGTKPARCEHIFHAVSLACAAENAQKWPVQGLCPKNSGSDYVRRRYPFEVDISAAFKKSSTLSRAVRDDVLDSRRYALVIFFLSTFVNKKHRAITFFTFRKMKFLRQMVWVCGSYQYGTELGTERKIGGYCWATAVAVYQHGLEVTIFANREAEIQRPRQASLEEFETLAKALEKVLQS